MLTTRFFSLCRYKMFSYLYDPIIHKMNLLDVEPKERKNLNFYLISSMSLFICLVIKHKHLSVEAHFLLSELLNLNWMLLWEEEDVSMVNSSSQSHYALMWLMCKQFNSFSSSFRVEKPKNLFVDWALKELEKLFVCLFTTSSTDNGDDKWRHQSSIKLNNNDIKRCC